MILKPFFAMTYSYGSVGYFVFSANTVSPVDCVRL